MNTTLIIEINSHTWNKHTIKITSIKVCKMQTVSRPKCSGCETFWATDKKQFNPDY